MSSSLEFECVIERVRRFADDLPPESRKVRDAEKALALGADERDHRIEDGILKIEDRRAETIEWDPAQVAVPTFAKGMGGSLGAASSRG